MSYALLDDRFHANPKVLSVGLAGSGLYARALSYCGAYLTDGFVPSSWAWAQISQNDDPEVLAHLTDAGLWVEVPGGYQIPDYLDFNPSREEVEKRREERSEAGKKGARSRWGGKSYGNSHSETHSKPLTEAIAEPMAKRWQNDAPKPLAPSPHPKPQERQASKSNSQGISESRPEEKLPVEKMRLAIELKAVAPVSMDGAATIDSLCSLLPEGSLAKVLESVAAKRGTVGPGYVINALRSEQRELAERSVA